MMISDESLLNGKRSPADAGGAGIGSGSFI
jgi:hypothetical protein